MAVIKDNSISQDVFLICIYSFHVSDYVCGCLNTTLKASFLNSLKIPQSEKLPGDTFSEALLSNLQIICRHIFWSYILNFYAVQINECNG